ncbi:MAG: flagellar hook-associated protein FlgL [Halobacteriovoraceae bacterium]|jgi:flagellar hook-associated protein 3 FlgL|nr:flagellar hook-associated protein FlgL [Halobacteriovoraceae bacterium]MBT5095924.1 flagellar hook-associated protein FlgL [Halobacteriovoraceae bacterium]
MTRVSENSANASFAFSLNKAKSRMEDLQLKGTNLKKITRPSQNPMANIEALNIDSNTSDNKQYIKNANFAQLQLNVTEKSLEELTDIVMKAKEIAIQQSSDFYDEDIRGNVANEITQLRNQALAIGNKRINQRYIFAGFKTLQKPFNESGDYSGDQGQSSLEISKDFFIPINMHGAEIFYSSENSSGKIQNPLEDIPELNQKQKRIDAIENGETPPPKSNPDHSVDTGRDLASTKTPAENFHTRENIFAQLSSLIAGLENNDASLVQSLLPKFDKTINRLITLRTRVGSLTGSIDNSKVGNESANIDSAERKSHLMDADIAELFSDITKQQNILKATYQTSQNMLNKSLLDFLR